MKSALRYIHIKCLWTSLSGVNPAVCSCAASYLLRGEEFPSAVLKSRLSPALSLTDRQEEDEEGDGRRERGGEEECSKIFSYLKNFSSLSPLFLLCFPLM